MKWTALMVLMMTITTACTKKPDAPAPDVATTIPPGPGQPTPPTTTPPPPVTNCQGSTIFYSMPIDTMPDNPVPNTKSFVIAGFETSCGDTLQVLIRNSAAGPGAPWSTLGDTPNGASYYTLTNQTVTVTNATGTQINVAIQATLN